MTEIKKTLPEAIASRDLNKPVFQNILQERRKTFEKKTSKFIGISKTFNSKLEEIPESDSKYVDGSFDPSNFKNENAMPESSIREQLDFLKSELSPIIDNSLSIEKTNTSNVVKTVLIVGEESFGEFSSAELLSLRNTMKALKDVYQTIPTIEGVNFEWDDKHGMFSTEENVTVKTKTVEDVIIVAPANQFQKEAKLRTIQKQIVVGEYSTINYSTLITSKEKHAILKRTQMFLDGIERALKRANNIELMPVNVAEKIFDFLHSEGK